MNLHKIYTAGVSAALGFLTMPFKGTGINALKVGK